MRSKEVSASTVAERMNRILQTYREQVKNDESSTEASTSAVFGQMKYSTERGLESHKSLLNFAAQIDSETQSDSAPEDTSYEMIETPQKSSRRQQPSRKVKRSAAKLAVPIVKRKQRKLSSTITSNALTAERTTSRSDFSDSNAIVPIKTSRGFNENDNRQPAE